MHPLLQANDLKEFYQNKTFAIPGLPFWFLIFYLQMSLGSWSLFDFKMITIELKNKIKLKTFKKKRKYNLTFCIFTFI